jgi:hypothetical protein
MTKKGCMQFNAKIAAVSLGPSKEADMPQKVLLLLTDCIGAMTPGAVYPPTPQCRLRHNSPVGALSSATIATPLSPRTARSNAAMQHIPRWSSRQSRGRSVRRQRRNLHERTPFMGDSLGAAKNRCVPQLDLDLSTTEGQLQAQRRAGQQVSSLWTRMCGGQVGGEGADHPPKKNRPKEGGVITQPRNDDLDLAAHNALIAPASYCSRR